MLPRSSHFINLKLGMKYANIDSKVNPDTIKDHGRKKKDHGGSLNSFLHVLSCSLGVTYTSSEMTSTLQTSRVLFNVII